MRERLEARREEIEATALTRVRAISDPAEVADPAYAEGLRIAVTEAVSYGIQTTGREGGDPPIPVALLAQARMAARVGIPLDTVLRRYFAGYSLLGYFVLEEAAQVGITDSAELQRQLAAHAGTFDRLVAAVSEEHGRESEARRTSTGRRQAEQIERLLAGELVDTTEIPYDFSGWHLGIVAVGSSPREAIRALTEGRDCRLLAVKRKSDVAWAWLGTRAGTETLDIERLCASTLLPDVVLAAGEPGQGLEGWRLTHRQAAAALTVALRVGKSPVLYREVALLASTVRDETLTALLRQRYVAPLAGERDGGTTAWETLDAYFAAGRNATSAAAALGISRQAVNGRLQLIEDRLGQPIAGCSTELELVLRLRKLDRRANRKD